MELKNIIMEENIYTLKNNTGSLSDDDKKSVNNIIKKYEDWHYDNPNASKEVYEDKIKEMTDEVTAISKGSAPQNPTSSPTPKSTSAENEPKIDEID